MKWVILIISILAPVFSFTSAMGMESTLHPSLIVQERYNDNIFLSSVDRQNDFIASVTPSLELTSQTGRSEFGLSYAPTFNRYASHSERNNTSHRATATAALAPSERLKITISDIFTRTEEPEEIRVLEDAGPVVGARNRLTINRLSGNVAYQANSRLSFTLDAVFRDSRNSTDTTFDMDVYTVGLGVQYRLTEITALLVRTTATFIDYAVRDDAKGQDYLVGLSHNFSPTLMIETLVGLSRTTMDESGNTKTGFRADFKLEKTFQRGSASLSYRQSVLAGTESGTPLDSKVLTIRYLRPLTERLEVSASVNYGRYKNVEAGGRNRKEFWAAAGLTYQLTPWANLLVNYSYMDSRAVGNDTGDYNNHLVTVGVRVFDMIRL